MKKVSRRALAALVLAAVLLGGTGLFTGQYFVKGADWAAFPGNPHVYENGVLHNAVVKDAQGETLLTLSGERIYAADAVTRKAFLHLLGDRSGNIPSPILQEYRTELTGYNSVFGTYGSEKDPSELQLTLSSAVQKKAFSLLNGRKGTIAVYNYVNGEILCAVSSPAFDPDDVPDIAEDTAGQYDGIYVNRFTGSVYVPGSIFKLVTAACALDTMPDTLLTRKFNCDGALEVGEDVVTCKGVHGEITLREALAKSCNCAFGELSMELGTDVMNNYVNKIGLTQTFAADGVQIQAGRFDLQDVDPVDLAWSGIGQHTVMVNPYSFLRFMGAIAGDGSAAEPHFVAKTGKYEPKTRNFTMDMDKNTTKILKEYMANNVQTVYGKENFPAVKICAKSGTAEVGEGLMPHATFAGFVDDARYPLAFVVVVENGGSGSSTCAKLTGDVLAACIEFMDLRAS